MSASNPTRPSADALLAESRRNGRGRLKIFLGAAPGVGKTYEMLSSAKAKLAQGIDVVAGIVETHGREETRTLLQGLPQIPRRVLTYRGRALEELDLDALLARRPQLALVDELAHTNVPGSRHAKRHQDIQEMLDAGIDVYTTLNVQHLESYNDLVKRITGVEVRETVPDSVLDLATDVELIDLSPDDLIERLRQGKVYVPEQARRALDNYFSRGNLLALRELALRAAAEHVDDDLSTFMRAHAIEGPWPTRGRLLVCIDATAASETLLRTAKRLADQRHLPWTALHVQTLGAVMSAAAQEQLDRNLMLAAQLGGETASLTADRVGAGVLDYARARNAAQIVVGRSHTPQWRRWWRGSLAHWLFENAEDFEITIVGPEFRNEQSKTTLLAAARRVQRLGAREVFLSMGVSIAATVSSALIDPWVAVENLSLIFLLGVAIVGSLAGLWAALLASAVCFVAYNLFFTEPRLTLLVTDLGDLRALFGFLIVSIVVGFLAGKLKRQASDASRNALRTEMLFDFVRRLATAVNERDLRLAAANGLEEILRMRCIVLEADAQGRALVPAELPRESIFRDTDQAAADWALAHDQAAGAGTTTLPAAGWYFLPLSAANQSFGVIALELPSNLDSLNAEDHRLLFSLQTQLTNAWERFRLRKHAEEAKLQRAAEGLRSALLASVSHDLRTPLVSVIGSLTAIRDLAAQLPPHDQRELIDNALNEAERLNRLIQNLLDATRLAQGGSLLRLGRVLVLDAARRAVSRVSDSLGRRVDLSAPADLAVRADGALLEQCLINLIENAGKYSPPDSRIRIVAADRAEKVVIRIADRGQGIAPGDLSRVFDLFFRAGQRDSGVPGSGLGLAICKGFIEAMGGKIGALPGENGVGATIEIELPNDDSGSMPAVDAERMP